MENLTAQDVERHAKEISNSDELFFTLNSSPLPPKILLPFMDLLNSVHLRGALEGFDGEKNFGGNDLRYMVIADQYRDGCQITMKLLFVCNGGAVDLREHFADSGLIVPIGGVGIEAENLNYTKLGIHVVGFLNQKQKNGSMMLHSRSWITTGAALLISLDLSGH